MWGYCTDALSWDMGQLTPGRTCKESFECYSGVCNEGRCMGTQTGGLCKKTEECEVGLYCSGTCTALKSMD